MNPSDDLINPSGDDRRLDLLVDGELGEAQRRALLCQLDHEPGGWRRCALAFLEAQSWKKEFGAIVAPAAARPQSPPARRQRTRQWLGTAMAMAASFLVALVVGRQILVPSRGPGLRPSAEIASAGKSIVPAGSARRQENSSGLAQARQGAADQWELVTLAGPRGADGVVQTIRLPAVRRETLDPQWLENLPQAVPADVLRALQQAGHEVQQHRELVPLEMQDGRRLVVPVDQIQVHYVGRPSL